MNTTPMGRMAFVITVGFFAVLGLLMFAPVNDELKDPLLLMLGALIGNFNSIVSYYFGTTNSSAKKDETIQDLSRTAQVVATTAQAAAGGDGPAAQVETVSIAADTVNVNKGKPP